MVFGFIFYWHNVVGDNTYYMYAKMGGANVKALTRAF